MAIKRLLEYECEAQNSEKCIRQQKSPWLLVKPMPEPTKQDNITI